jgi:hypothetical protein
MIHTTWHQVNELLALMVFRMHQNMRRLRLIGVGQTADQRNDTDGHSAASGGLAHPAGHRPTHGLARRRDCLGANEAIALLRGDRDETGRR